MRRIALTVVALLALARPAVAADPTDLVRVAEALVQLDRSMGDLMFLLREPARIREAVGALRDEILADPILGPLLGNLVELYRERVWRASAFAHLSGESSGAAGLAVGTELVWDSGLCRLLDLGLDAQLYRDDDSAAGAYALRAGGCLPLPANTVTVTYQRSHAVRPSLLRLPVGYGGRIASDRFDLGIRFYRFRTENHALDAAPLTLTLERENEVIDAGTVTHYRWDLSVAFVRWARRGRGFLGGERVWEFFSVRATGLDEDAPGPDPRTAPLSGLFTPVRVEGLRLADALHLDAEVGLQFGELHTDAGVVARNLQQVGGGLALRSGVDRLSGELGYHRLLEPVAGDQLLAEHRLSTSLSVRGDRTLTVLDAYVAASRAETLTGAGPRYLSTAGGVRVGRMLRGGMTLWLRGELGRTMVADPVTAELSPALGARVMLSVASQINWEK